MKKLSSFVLIFIVAFSGIFQIAVSPSKAASVVNYDNSRVSVDKTSVQADGIDQVRITVTLKDGASQAVSGKKVYLASSRDGIDEISVEKDITDTFGKASFLIRSLKNGESTFTIWIDNKALSRTVNVAFGGGLRVAVNVGDLIKIPDDGDAKTLNDTAVYYYGKNGRRFVFPNEKVYFTWYKDFGKVKVIPLDQMSLIPIGSNVTYKSASKLVKFQTDTKTYLPTKGGTLRWVKTEEAARGLFGAQWNTNVDDITEAFYVNYKFGDPIESAFDAPLDIISQGSPDISTDKGL
ncbi:Ig-like domain-containing protein [Candidatus Uhrbacteria bacterium]|nr:Ig-like domain-containing protein [Candidatus Uhrbacteria bacterium]